MYQDQEMILGDEQAPQYPAYEEPPSAGSPGRSFGAGDSELDTTAQSTSQEERFDERKWNPRTVRMMELLRDKFSVRF